MGDTSTNDAWRRHLARMDAKEAPPEPTQEPTLHDLWQAHRVRYDAAEAAAAEAAAARAPRTDAIGRTLRHDGWTPERQKTFLDAVAEGLSTEQACRIAGMSPSAAYSFKKRAAGKAFALGWRAAQLLGRERIADTMLDRAVNGFTETITRPDGTTIERHRFDNRMAMAMLARLDRQAEATDAASLAANAAARAVADEFDTYLDLLGGPAPAAGAAHFLACRAAAPADLDQPADPLAAAVTALDRADRVERCGTALAADVDTADLDPADRAGWTAEQWQRADAAGLIHLAPAEEPAPDAPLSPLVTDSDGDDHGDLIWQDARTDQWRTSFPPPADFNGDESGSYGDPRYHRELSLDELGAVVAEQVAEAALARRAAAARRDDWFAQCAEEGAALRQELAEAEPADPAPPAQASPALFFAAPAGPSSPDSLFRSAAPI